MRAPLPPTLPARSHTPARARTQGSYEGLDVESPRTARAAAARSALEAAAAAAAAPPLKWRMPHYKRRFVKDARPVYLPTELPRVLKPGVAVGGGSRSRGRARVAHTPIR